MGQDVWVTFQFQYDKCFDCGECMLAGSNQFHGDEDEKQFGVWLSAQSLNRMKEIRLMGQEKQRPGVEIGETGSGENRR